MLYVNVLQVGVRESVHKLLGIQTIGQFAVSAESLFLPTSDSESVSPEFKKKKKKSLFFPGSESFCAFHFCISSP